MRNNKGFTLMELMMTLLIVAVLAMLGMPSYDSLIRSTRLTGTANEFIGTLGLARSEAVGRNTPVTVRKLDINSCTKGGANWEHGWDVFTDINADGNCDTGTDVLIKTFPALPAGYTLRGNSNTVGSYLLYKASGAIKDGTIGSFYLCQTDNPSVAPIAGTAKLIAINWLGRPRIGLDVYPSPNGNGIPDVPAGNADITSCN